MRAPTSAVLTQRPDTIAGVLDQGFELYARSFWRVTGYLLLAGVPNGLLGIAFIKAQEPLTAMLMAGSMLDALAKFWWLLPVWLIAFYFSIGCYGATIYRLGVIARDQDPGWWPCLRQGLSDAPKLFGQTLLLMMLFSAALFAGLAWVGLAAAAGGAAMLAASNSPFAPLLIAFWSIVLVLPALALIGIAMVPMVLSPIALLLLRQGVISSIGTGFRLMGQHFWRSTTLLSVPGLLYALLSTGAGALTGISSIQQNWGKEADMNVQIAVQLLGIPINALLFPLLCASAIALFSDLLLRREGRDLQAQLARLSS